MNPPILDIFRGHFGSKDAMWIEAIEGLGNAVDRMHIFAAEKPDSYFVFDARTHKVIATTDTTRKLESKRGAA